MSDSNKAAEVAAIMAEFHISQKEAEISWERRKVYGDPWINHLGIAQAWTGLLQPWALRIARMDPIPPHVVALMMVGLKTNRCRMTFHSDNYDDASVYAGFARTWQERWIKEGGESPVVIMPPPSKMHRLNIGWVPETKVPEGMPKFTKQTEHKGGMDKMFKVQWDHQKNQSVPVTLTHGGKTYRLTEIKG